ncbi:MAG: 1-(5-phosphoribosyl)-5-[(5-phosphoribosylamino)methylideneamino]imidazole-4-carboxamide isomerase [Clostridiaceae bacterium]|nr:1-(5-phosphoribosyl)-5-[(5-phosphoribosylamino)methylideneamino]imidazole-4-carboxamide isomerase [Clostridiaceae bacterium]
MVLYPAIDILGGKCVRLSQGRYNDVTVYSDNPIDVALKFQEYGADYIHIVDLDAARGGSDNRKLIINIANQLDIPVQTGGGIRTLDDIKCILQSRVERVIIGTAAVKNPDVVKEAVSIYGPRIAVGIDAKDGMVAVEGWEEISSISALELAARMESFGVRTIIYTDIATDGMLSGPNTEAIRQMVAKTNMEVIASGGVSSINDLLELKKAGAAGTIIGKAIYTGAIDLKEALERINK